MTSALLRHVDLLSCPHCGRRLKAEASIKCSTGHSFDIAREGYVNLSTPRVAKLRSDTRGMVEARIRLQATGVYGPLAKALVAMHRPAPAGPLVDLGCGPGTYLRALLAERGRRAVGIDLSRDAVRRAVRSAPSAALVVGDVADRIPLASESFALALSAFAPRAPAEIARILQRDGLLIVAAAGESHLQELVENLDLLEVPGDKLERLTERLETSFSIEKIERITYTMQMSPQQIRDVVLMGPNRWHLTDRQSQALNEIAETAVTADFLLVTAAAA